MVKRAGKFQTKRSCHAPNSRPRKEKGGPLRMHFSGLQLLGAIKFAQRTIEGSKWKMSGLSGDLQN